MLAPVFADLPPGHAAGRGGPDRRGVRRAGARQPAACGPPAARRWPGQSDGEQRARWVALAGQAADEAGLPADAEFRAALAAFLEWGSRARRLAARPPGAGRPAGPPDTTPAAPRSRQPAGHDCCRGPERDGEFRGAHQPLFRERDQKSMSFAFDLWSCDDVRAHARGILARLQDGSMPCDGAWPAEQVAVFQRWVDSGMQP